MRDLFSEQLCERLLALAESRSDAFHSAQPFPHIAIDDFLPPEPLRRAIAEFPGPGDLQWQRFRSEDERKLAFNVAERMPASIRELLYFLNSATVLQFLERLTSISRLVPDPYFAGGGLHQIEPGGHLGIHADFNVYERLGLDRRLNLLLYLNEDWAEEYGGHLELWDRSMQRCEVRLAPVFNRCVVFATTDFSYHGHPDPLRCPAGRTRRSLATYYYTNGRPEEEQSPAHTTLFRERPTLNLMQRTSRFARRAARELLPPIVTRLLGGNRRG
jgi:hypothetical protein